MNTQLEDTLTEVGRQLDVNNYYLACAALETLVGLVSAGVDESDWYLKSSDWSLSDLIVGAYWFLSAHHTGQGSDEYRLLSKISQIYDPGPLTRGPAEDSCEQLAYDALARAKAGRP